MPDLLDWAARAGAGAAVDLVCHDADAQVVPGSAGATVVRLEGCAGEAPLALPYELLARGVAHVTVRLDACPRSERAGLTDRWVGLVATHAPHRVSVRDEPPEPATPVEPLLAERMPSLTRRGLLGLLSAPGDDAPAPSGTAHQRLRRAVAAVAVSDAAEPANPAPGADPADPAVPGATHPGVGLVLEASECDVAGVCVQACPEDALAVERRGARAQLVLEPGACSGCGLCLMVCPTEALHPVGVAAWGTLVDGSRVVVADVETRTCERCRASFRARGSQPLCPTCAFRRANPFASALPDEVKARLREGR